MNRDMLRENRVHGNPMYPVSIYPNVEQLNGQCILDCHWHDEMEFIVVREGSASFQIDMTTILVKAGEAVFINRGEIHAGYLAEGAASCVFSAVVFSADFLGSQSFDALQEKFINPLIKRQLVPNSHIRGNTPAEKEILHYLDQILAANEAVLPTRELTTKAQLYMILAHMHEQMQIVKQDSTQAGSHDKVERLKTVLNYIHEHYAQPLKLKQLADLINMSEGHFCRFFKQMVQKSPVEYLNHYRTQKACKQLENTDHKIVDIAMDVGFDNLSYFITVFKQHKGCTPSQYRKEFYEKVNLVTV